jgi:hypothetical protein
MFFRPIFFSQAPGTAVHGIHQIHGVHHGRPPAATMTLDRFVGPLSADSSPPPLPAIVAARGCRQGGSRTGPPCKSTAKDHPDHVPSQRELEGTRRLRPSTLGPRLAENPLRPRSCRNLTGQSEGDPHIICDSCYCGIRVQGSTVIDLRLIVPASLLREISLACLSALEPALPFPHRACLGRHLHKISTTPTFCPRHSSCPPEHLNINRHQSHRPSHQPLHLTLDNISLFVSLLRPNPATASLHLREGSLF